MELRRDDLIAPDTFFTFLQDYTIVGLGDLFSLIFCNGWREPYLMESYQAILHGDCLRIAPDPFEGATVPLDVEARRIPARVYHVGRGSSDHAGGGPDRPPLRHRRRRPAAVDLMSRILVVEDDRDIADLIVHYLNHAGHDADVLTSGADALPAARKQVPDVLILDRMLPGLDGLEVCRAMRSDPATASVPIIMLTARAEESDRIVGLELGADDYVTKPFSPKELVARVNAQLRRTRRQAPPEDKILRFQSLAIDLDRHVVSDGGREVKLTAKEFLLLQYFLEHRGRVLSRDLLLSDVWGYQYTGGTRTVDVHVRRLREKLPVLANAIETVKQFGYKLVAAGDEDV